MKGSWPKVTCSIERRITASHSLREMGNPDFHSHEYLLRAGYTHEINPRFGVTKSMSDMRPDLDELANMLDGKNLNEVLPFEPTAEIMACWIMANLPAYWDFVEIECYDGYKVRSEANGMRREWSAQFEIKK